MSAELFYSVEMLGSAWTLCGTIIRKLCAALAKADNALGLVVLARGLQLAGVMAQQLLDIEHRLGVELL